jgi:hypothetical protein
MVLYRTIRYHLGCEATKQLVTSMGSHVLNSFTDGTAGWLCGPAFWESWIEGADELGKAITSKTNQMAIVIQVDGSEFEVLPGRRAKGFTKRELSPLIGRAIGIFVLDARRLMLVNLASLTNGALLNTRAMKVLGRTVLQPFSLVCGPVVIAEHQEVELADVVGEGLRFSM